MKHMIIISISIMFSLISLASTNYYIYNHGLAESINREVRSSEMTYEEMQQRLRANVPAVEGYHKASEILSVISVLVLIASLFRRQAKEPKSIMIFRLSAFLLCMFALLGAIMRV